jgi:argininosuccinate synthase
MQTTRGVLALAFSGGLDTSYCVPRLAEAGWTVHTVFVNTGGSTPAQRAAIRAQAQAVGAVEHHEVDARQLVYDRFVRYLVQGNVLRGEVYPLSVAAERTQQALSVLEVARTIGAKAIAHGSTGAGNDQIRFDIALRVLAPDLEIVTPIREGSVRREESIAYLRERGLPVPEKAGSYSINRGLWGTTWGGGWTHDTWAGPPPELIDPPADAPAPSEIVIAWDGGLPVSLDGAPLAGPALIERLGDLAESYGVGRNIHVGETALGIKGRIGFEAGAALILIAAHRDVARHDAGIAAQGPAGAERSGEHVARTEREHAARRILDGVVGRFVLENADGEHVALGGHDLVAHDDLGRERGVAGRAADPVEPDAGGDHLLGSLERW